MWLPAAVFSSLALGAVWEVNDLLPVLTATVEAQIGEIAKQFHAEPKSAPPRFQQQHRNRLREELDGLVREVWQAENEYSKRTTGHALRPDELVAKAKVPLRPEEPSFRQLANNEINETDERMLLFELDAEGISKIFNESLAAATAPLKSLYKMIDFRDDAAVNALSINEDVVKRPKKKLPAEVVRDGPTDGFPVKFAFSDFVVMTTVERLLANRHAIAEVTSATADHFKKVAFVWPHASRFAGLQKDVLPIYNDLLPVLQGTAFRGLAALMEMSPRRINGVTFVSATMEMVTLLTRIQSMVDVLLPLSGVVLTELEDGAAVLEKYFPLLEEYIPQLRRFLPSIKEMDPYYAKMAEGLDRTLGATDPIIQDIKKIIGPYTEASPTIRKLLEVVSGLSLDVSDTMEQYLERLTREAPAMLEFYEDADGFVPLLATNLISVIRRSGLPARFPSLRSFMPALNGMRPAVKEFLTGLQEHLPPLVEEIVPLAASMPRHDGALEHLSDFLVHASIAGSAFNSTLLPSLTSLMEVVDPFMDSLNAPVINLVVFLPLLASAVTSMLSTLPRIAAWLPAVSPLMASMHNVTEHVAPVIPNLSALMGALGEWDDTHFNRMRHHIVAFLSEAPTLFGREKITLVDVAEIEVDLTANNLTLTP